MAPHRIRPPRRALAAVALAAALVLLTGVDARAGTAPQPCPSTFRVLHDDHVGALVLPAGAYEIGLLPGNPGCAGAATRFARFLQDFDGVLPSPWVVDAANSAFTTGGLGLYGFTVTRVTTPRPAKRTPGRYPAAGERSCPALFTVLHDDRIGTLRLDQGSYRLVAIGDGMSCASAAGLFRQFLQDTDGVLPRPWRLDADTATFRRGAAGPGLRVEPVDPAAA